MEGRNNFYELSVHCYYRHRLCHSLLRSVILVSIVEANCIIWEVLYSKKLNHGDADISLRVPLCPLCRCGSKNTLLL
jgi:hypothetical protein